MRFLCFHGRGTNAEIFKSQTSRIREFLGQEHDFVFINGTVPAKALARVELDMASVYGQEHRGFWPLESRDEDALRQVYNNLRAFMISNGPFDGLVGFSEGGGVAATLIVEDARRHNHELGIKCGIFFCALSPIHLNLDQNGKARLLDSSQDGVIIRVPTAHIWSLEGEVAPGLGRDLATMCDITNREELVHNLGHDVPGAHSDEMLRETVRVITRTIERAKAG